LRKCEEILEISPVDFLCDLTETPRFWDEPSWASIAGYRHAVVEVSEGEAEAHGPDWKSGFYFVRMGLEEAYVRLMA
jgi:hypothetical protein